MNDKKEITRFLKTVASGEANCIRGVDLARAVGVSENELRRRINKLRRNGVPIGSSCEGYFYAVNAGELYSTIGQLRLMASGLEAAIRGLEGAMVRFGEDGGDS